MGHWRDIESESLPPEHAAWWLRHLVGAVHRLVWVGDTPEGDRKRCLDLLRRALFAGSMAPEQRQLVDVVNWWVGATLGEDVVGRAWQKLDLPHGLAEPLERVIHSPRQPALPHFRRPVRFRDAVAALDALLDADRMPRLRVAPAPTLYGEARSEATAVQKAARRRDPEPPSDLRLLNDDLEAWASERRDTRFLLPHVKVWFALHKVLEELSERVSNVVDLWTVEATPSTPLPADWRATLKSTLGDRAEIAEGLLSDLDVDDPARPPCFTPEWSLQSLARVPRKLEFSTRVRLLALAREARAAAPAAKVPDWVEQTEERLAEMLREARSLLGRATARGVTEAMETASQAATALGDLDTKDAEEWISLARGELEDTAADARLAALEQRGSEQLADLRAAGHDVGDLAQPPDHEMSDYQVALEWWAEQVDDRWRALEQETRARVQDTRDRTRRLPASDARDNASKTLEAASAAIEAGVLGRAVPLLATAEQAVAAAREMLEPELQSLLTRRDRSTGLGPVEQRGFTRLVEVIRTRASAELDYQPLIEAAQNLLESLDAGGLDGQRVLGLVTRPDDDGPLVVRSLCWLGTGVPVDPERAPLVAPQTAGFAVGQLVEGAGPGEPAEPPADETLARLARLEPLEGAIADWSPGGPSEVPLCYGHDPHSDRVIGPFRVNGGAPLVADRRDFLAELPKKTFTDTFMTIELGDGSALVLDAFDLDTLIDELGADPRDPMDADAQARWLAQLLAGLEGVRPTALLGCLEDLQRQQLPTELLKGRMRRLSHLIEVSRWLEDEREIAATAFLATDEGERLKERLAKRYAVDRQAEVEREVQALRAAKEAELSALDDQLVQLRAEVGGEKERILAETRTARAELEQLESMRDTALLRVIAQVSGGAVGAPRAAPTETRPIESKPVSCRPFGALVDLADSVCHHVSGADAQLVCSLLATYLTTPWILFAGPPGGGKSTLARDLASAFGAHAESGRHLELVVRREWQDDGALFGFWHPQQQVWMPSSDGLAEFLLAAEHDWREGPGALHVALLEELNLASPEYYLSRLISALEDDDPQVRLYGESQSPANHLRYPARFSVNPNVRLVGTVNVDETVERLSPRFLSRAAVVWLEASPDDLFGPMRQPGPPVHPVDWRAATEHALAVESNATEGLRGLVRFLHEKRVVGAPTKRTIAAIRRYLAVATRILPEPVAQDFAITQRVLPTLHGVGAPYRDVFEELQERLDRGGWPRLAKLVQRIRERGAELGDFYDFFHA